MKYDTAEQRIFSLLVVKKNGSFPTAPIRRYTLRQRLGVRAEMNNKNKSIIWQPSPTFFAPKIACAIFL